MNIDSFKEFLKNRKLETEKINATVDTINECEKFFSKQGKSIDTANYEDIYNYSKHLIKNNKNILDNYLALVRFGHYMKNNQIITSSIEIIDGDEVMTNFSKRLITEFGEEIENSIFNDIKLPPLGSHPQEKPNITKELMKRFLSKVEHEKCVEFLAKGLRDKYTASYQKPREQFLETKNIDDFLELKHQDLVLILEKNLEEGTLFYTQEVDQQVIDFVKKDLSIETGIREGNKIKITKMPYMIKQYLNETDEQKKKYYYCHCPWVREGFLKEHQPVSPIFCNCSAGYFKNYWDAVLGHPVDVEMVESILNGDKFCKFVFKLPPEILNPIK